MIVILKQNPNRDQLESLISWLQEKGVTIHTSIGEAHTILGLVGDTSKLDMDLISAIEQLHRQYLDSRSDLEQDIRYILEATGLLMAGCLPAV